MPKTLLCPKCKTEISVDTAARDFGGMCPKCLFKLLVEPPGVPEEAVSPAAPTRVIEGAPAESSPLIGKEFGNYKILGMLGSGGMGVVYKARQKGLERYVALKVLSAGPHASSEDVERFLREARSAAKLQHPHIVPIHEVSSHEGQYFFTMDLIEGKTLAEILRDPAFTPRKALEVVKKAASAVHYAHEHGIIHRDLKPQNILVDAAGEPKVMDFGLAKDVSSDAGLTKSGTAMGTPSYMAPEQAAGELEKVDKLTDVYALGAVLYECLTRRPPFIGRSPADILTRVLRSEPPQPHVLDRTIQRDIETICLKALEKNRARRYPSAAAMAEDIDRFLNGQTIHARPASVGYRIRKTVARHKAVSVVVAAACAAVVMVALYFLTRPGFLSLDTAPSEAQVWLDGRPIGVTPLKAYRCAGGRHRLLLKAKGYDDAEHEINVGRGSTADLFFPLYAQTEILHASSTPSGAKVRIVRSDGSVVSEGVAPLSLLLERGAYRIVFTEIGYVEKSEELTVRGGNLFRQLAVTLEKDTGLVRLETQQEGVEATFDSLEGPRESRRMALSRNQSVELPSGLYRLTLEKTNGITQRREIKVDRGGTHPVGCYVPDRTLWTYRTDAYTAPLLVDLNGDGTPDAIVGGTQIYAIDGLTGRQLWAFPRSVPKDSSNYYFGLAAADVAGDGRPTIFACSNTGITALTAEGKLVWTYTYEKAFSAGLHSWAPSIGDVAGDARPSLILGTEAGILILDARNGSLLRWIKSLSVEGPITLADIDGDGVLDLIFGEHVDPLRSTGGRATAYSFKADKILWRFESPDRSEMFPAIGRFTGAGHPDVVMATQRGNLYLVDGKSGKELHHVDIGEPIHAPPSLVDLDGDGIPEIVVATVQGRLVVISGAKFTPLWSVKVSELPLFSPAIGDIEGDSRPGIVVAGMDGHVRAFRGRDATLLWQYQTPSGFRQAPSLADLDHDGCLDVIIVERGGTVRAIKGGEGQIRWRSHGEPVFDGHVTSCDLAKDGVRSVVFKSILGNFLRAVDGLDGRLLWTYERKGFDLVRDYVELSDVDGDGVNDLAVVTNEGNAILLDGARGKVIRQSRIAVYMDTLVGGIDLNGDGYRDFVMWGTHGVLAFSGKDLTPLWSVDLERIMRETLFALIPDSPPRGHACVIVAASNRDPKDRHHEYLVVALDGRDGRQLWQRPCADEPTQFAYDPRMRASDGNPAVVAWLGNRLSLLRLSDGSVVWERPAGELRRMEMGVAPYELPLLDANGDGIPDIVAALADFGIKVFDGRSGRVLWTLPKKGYFGVTAITLLPDLNGDSVPELAVVWESRLLQIISGSNGKVLWECALQGTQGEPELITAITAVPSEKFGPALAVGTYHGDVWLIQLKWKGSAALWEGEAGLDFTRTKNFKGAVPPCFLRSNPKKPAEKPISLREAEQNMRSGFLEEAIEGFRRIAERPPEPSDLPKAMFGCACCHAYLREDDKALELLEKAAGAGLRIGKEDSDPDAFERLKENVRYKAAMKILLSQPN